MMENSPVGEAEHLNDLQQTFLDMLADQSAPMLNGYPYQGLAEVDARFDDEIYKVALAMSPMDDGSQGQNQSLPKIDLQMIDDIIGESQDMQVDGNGIIQQVTQGYPYPSSSPQLYDTPNFVFAQQNEEVSQMVPVQNPSAMISGIIPQLQPTTIDQSQLQDSPLSQIMSVDPSESMSVDNSVPGSVTDDELVAETRPAMGGDQMEEEGQMTKPMKAEEVPTLPDVKELLIRIRYRSQEVVRELVKNSNGCLVYYSKPWQFPVMSSPPAGVEFPDITEEQRNAMTESQFKFTEQVLKAVEKGLFLRCDAYGNVYATRFCRSKIFWYSTEKGPIADAQITGNAPSLTFQKLERSQEVMVFDNMLFQKKLLHYVVNKPTFKSEAANAAPNRHSIPISPAVFFTFAQSWNPMNSALSSCLVSMVVNPVRARMQRQWGNDDRHESYDLSNYQLQMSSQNEASEKS